MIKIDFKYDKEKDIHSLKVEGHAGFDSIGKDIVCAGVSTLVYTLIQNLDIMQEADRICEYERVIEEGNTFIRVTPVKAYSDQVFMVFKTVVIGFGMLEYNFPKNILINFEGWG